MLPSDDSVQVNNKTKKMRKNWGYWALVMFLLVIAVLVYFGFVCAKRSRSSIEERLSLETAVFSERLGSVIDSAISETASAASVVGRNSINSEFQLRKTVEGMESDIADVYLVVATNTYGVGYASNGDAVDISKMDYQYIGAAPQCVYTENDGITGKSAFVVTAPYVIDNVLCGYIYAYLDSETVYEVLPTKNYGSALAFAIVNTDGNLIAKRGADSYFNNGDNFFTILSTANVEGLSLSQIKLKIEKLTRAFFYANKGSESRAIAMAPVGDTGWEFVMIMNKTFVDSVIESDMAGVVKLIAIVIIALCLFAVFMSLMFLLNKFRQKEEKENLEDKADTDLLTGVNNKIATERKIQEYMTENPETQCLMFLFDIDNFKKINDTMGHSFGDEVLRTLGHQLTNEFRVTDIIGRLGGDEFVVLLKNIKNEEQLEREGQRITALFHQFKAGDYVKYSATASIGAVVFPRDAKDFQSAYKAADKALYEAKRRGKNQLVFYNSNLADVKSIRVDDRADNK